MATSSINNYKLNHKLHPLSLLAQLTSRKATGCLRVFTDTASWTINLDAGKLTYASYSDKLFARLDQQLRRLSQKIPTLNSATRIQMRLMFEPKGETQSIIYADYQAICWLVEQNHLTSKQAAVLIEELGKEVIATFLLIKEGSYEFFPDATWEELPKFCHLDLRLLVEHCQKQLRNRQQTQPSVNTDAASQVPPSKPSSPPTSQPNSPEVKENSQPTATPSLVRKTLYTIACIDDSPTVLNSIKSFLDENVFTVVTINDPVKALMQILRSKPDLILLDVEMPNLDGYELCSLLRRHSAFKNTPIIMVTGRTGFIDRAKAKMVRSSGYLTKPFDQSELLKIVFKHLG
ncbi:response regulator [Anabaena azotica]|uniref:Response regulator n=1 Tax=Anabaena azotica FACHB-119 TaxID=947527 RepID=A0ABR8CZ82_9NOST|nr:response regulator [Anabaena azotica]MBD2499468.1 response regulator [Anabaena azotica FACHB-119]